ncbi:hypothetical protein [Serinicoccus sp. CUA-874]|uniref:hypothetical protein n=1 Tax=Serinicoccus sp. CUA-874 TaxID=1517939 RepID=UPI001EDA5C59|nr:hypothetical protein [Serinicoccus sp. CUA-874]
MTQELPWPVALPAGARSRLEAILAPLPEHRRTTFALRVARRLDELVAGLAPYPDPPALAARALELAARAYLEREDDLHLLDERRSLEPDWFQRPDLVGYAGYAERLTPEGRCPRWEGWPTTCATSASATCTSCRCCSPARRPTTAVTRSPTTARSAPTWARWPTCAG